MISINNARNFSNSTYQKASNALWSKEADDSNDVSTEQENNDNIDEIIPEQLALLATQAHAWIVVISDNKLSKQALIHYGIDIHKILNITHQQLSASRIQLLSKQNISFVVMVQKNKKNRLPEPYYSQLTFRCVEQNLRLLSITQQQKSEIRTPVQLPLLNFEIAQVSA